MEVTDLRCPLCCDKTFITKSSLIEHLVEVAANIICPICNNKWSSVEHLVEHLTLDNCQPDSINQTITFAISAPDENAETITQNSNFEQLTSNEQIDDGTLHDNAVEPFSTAINLDGTEHGAEVKMYVELLSKQLTKPCLKTQEIKLVKEHGVSRYMIMTNEDSNLSVGSTVMTKQNNDGTISLTTLKDMKLETETVIIQENDTEENEEEVYSCNTCSVSFTSVLDHIQNYHSDQDVVVEETMEDEANQSLPMEFSIEDPITSEELGDTQAPRRMITETGNIIEAPLTLETSPIVTDSVSDSGDKAPVSQVKDEARDSEEQDLPRRYVQIEKLCDSIIKDIKQPDDKNGPYHKVVVKDMQTSNGQKLKVYHCISCSIYVLSLDEFKSRPCKVSKFPCPHCPVAYENSKSLSAHLKVHKSKNRPDVKKKATKSDLYVCAVCDTTFPTNKSLKLHKRMHDPVKTRPIEPPVETPEGGEVSQDKFLCVTCDKLIPIDYRAIHQNSHKNSEKFNCEVCNKKFQSNEYLEMHMSVHSSDKVPISKQDLSNPYRCLYCERRFARPHEKVKHERIHTGEKPHCCEICGKSFRVSYCLTLHMRTHTGARPYGCPHCGKRFKAHSVYNHHLLTHSEVRAYKCPYCPKAFKTSVQLAGHKNSHTKPFSCQHCNRPFASLYAVRVHTETHARQNNLKFSCALCGASYARAFALKDHIKQVHKEELDNPETFKNLNKDEDWVGKPTAKGSLGEEIQNSEDLPNEVNMLLGS